MGTYPCIIHFLILLLLFVSGNVYGARARARDRETFNLVSMESLRPASTCSPTSKGLPLMHRHGPCSPLSHNSPPPNSHRLFLKDQSRVNFIHNPNSTTIPIGAGGYVVTVGIGTPESKFTLIVDTGSDLTWVQSKTCSRCYPQDEPIYDPSASSTHIPMPDDGYTMTYADGGYSRGQYAEDTLTLPGYETVPNFTFGCGTDNSDGFGRSAGMLGLSRADLSLVSQTRSTFSQTFCYCLTSREGNTGYLFFGNEALSKCEAQTYTPLLVNPKSPQLYFVDLVGITIGAKRLAVSGSKSPNTVLDSGTVISRLPPSVYSLLRDEFKRLMSGYPEAPSSGLMDTCYDVSGFKRFVVPHMVLHFTEADVDLDRSGVIWRESESQVCLAFAANKHDSDSNIIGSVQQKTLGILYNVPDNKVGFQTDACS